MVTTTAQPQHRRNTFSGPVLLSLRCREPLLLKLALWMAPPSFLKLNFNDIVCVFFFLNVFKRQAMKMFPLHNNGIVFCFSPLFVSFWNAWDWWTQRGFQRQVWNLRTGRPRWYGPAVVDSARDSHSAGPPSRQPGLFRNCLLGRWQGEFLLLLIVII